MSEFVTLSELRKTAGDDVDRNVIDEFVKSSFILANLPFHQAAAPTGGSALAYTYTRLATQPGAAFRALNADYTADTVEVTQETVVCKPLGGKFKVDRVLGGFNSTQVSLQISQLVKAAGAAFADAVINGDTDADANAFDGLSVALTGSTTEVDASTVDWSAISTEAAALSACEVLDDVLTRLDGSQGVAILTNRKGKLKLQSIARRAGYLTHSEGAAGTPIASYAGVPIIDLGAKAGSNDDVIATTDGATDFYVVRMGIDGFHGVSPQNGAIVNTYLPNFNDAAAVAEGAVEMVAAVALKATKAAAVLRGVQIEAAPEVG